jgi:circadian clock protein KaiC
LVSGTAGTGKTSLAAYFAHESCRRKERCIYFAFEEAPEQIIRNMRSINIDLAQHIKSGMLKFHASRPTLHGLEMHLVVIYKEILKFRPKTIILDPITNLITVGTVSELKSILIRLIDFLQKQQITVLFTALSLNNVVNEQTDEGVSSLVDAWLMVRDIEFNGERNRGMYIMKSRGMAHSNQVREFVISSKGLELVEVFLGPDGVLTGSARQAHQLMEETDDAIKTLALSRKDREVERKSALLESQISVLRSEFESVKEELNKIYLEEDLKKEVQRRNREKMLSMRREKSKSNPSRKK